MTQGLRAAKRMAPFTNPQQRQALVQRHLMWRQKLIQRQSPQCGDAAPRTHEEAIASAVGAAMWLVQCQAAIQRQGRWRQERQRGAARRFQRQGGMTVLRQPAPCMYIYTHIHIYIYIYVYIRFPQIAESYRGSNLQKEGK